MAGSGGILHVDARFILGQGLLATMAEDQFDRVVPEILSGPQPRLAQVRAYEGVEFDNTLGRA